MAHEAIQKAKSLVKMENVEKVKSLFARKAKTEPTKKRYDPTANVGRPHKSKLVMCIEILCTLVSKGPMNLAQLIRTFEMDETRLTAHIRLLWNRGLIEEEKLDDDQTYYLVTKRGKTVLNVVGPIIKEAVKIQMREYDYLSDSLLGAGYK